MNDLGILSRVSNFLLVEWILNVLAEDRSLDNTGKNFYGFLAFPVVLVVVMFIFRAFTCPKFNLWTIAGKNF